MESLSRPVSGERSSHDDNESVGSVRPGSAASSNITGKLKSNRTHSVEEGRGDFTQMFVGWEGRDFTTWNDQLELTRRLCKGHCGFWKSVIIGDVVFLLFVLY